MTALIVVLAVLIVIWIALMQPVWLRVVVRANEPEIAIRYLGLTIRPSLGDTEAKDEDESAPASDEHPEPEQKKRKSGSSAKWLKLLPESVRAVKIALFYLLRRILVKRLIGRGTMGFDDPAVTGMAYGLYHAVIHTLPFSQLLELEIDPDFENGQTRMEGEFEGGIRPSSVIASGCVFLWHLPKLKLIRAFRS